MIWKSQFLVRATWGKQLVIVFEIAGHEVTYYGSKDQATTLGEIVIMAVPYPALAALAKQYATQLKGKIVVDITNPLNFDVG